MTATTTASIHPDRGRSPFTLHFVTVTNLYVIILAEDSGTWTATCRRPPHSTIGTTLRDALDEMALTLDRDRREDDNAPH